MMSVGHSKFFGVENAAAHRAARSRLRQVNCRMRRPPPCRALSVLATIYLDFLSPLPF